MARPRPFLQPMTVLDNFIIEQVKYVPKIVTKPSIIAARKRPTSMTAIERLTKKVELIMTHQRINRQRTVKNSVFDSNRKLPSQTFQLG